MAVQTRSVLKTYFETGDKPTAVQFGDLIDSALMAKTVNPTGSAIDIVANTIYYYYSTSTTMIQARCINLAAGESFVLNVVGDYPSHIDAPVAFNGQTTIYGMHGMAELTADDSDYLVSYAAVVVSYQIMLVNKAYYASI